MLSFLIYMNVLSFSFGFVMSVQDKRPALEGFFTVITLSIHENFDLSLPFPCSPTSSTASVVMY